MKRSHSLLLALLLGVAAVAATFAVVTTTSLGMSAKQPTAVPSAGIAARNAKLDRVEAALRRALRQKPPALPKRPKRLPMQAAHVVSVPAPAAQAAVAAPPPPAVSAPSTDDGGSHEVEHDDSAGEDGGGDD